MTDKAMLDILSTFSQATDESKPLTESKRPATADSEMAGILGKLQQLNESVETVEEAEKKCDDCGEPVSKCKCEDHDHKKEMDESSYGTKKKKMEEDEVDEASCGSKKKHKHESAIAEGVAQIEERLLKEFAEFSEAHCTPAHRKKKMKEDPNEGNEFSGELAKAKAAGAKTFKVGDKEYDVKEDFDAGAPVGSKKKTKHGTLEKTDKGVKHTRDYKPDYLDLDGDGDKKEPMKKAAKDKKAKDKK